MELFFAIVAALITLILWRVFFHKKKTPASGNGTGGGSNTDNNDTDHR